MHKETMEMANYWIKEKQLVHKLFKVLVPRYQNYNISFTKLYKAPSIYPVSYYDRTVLELRGREYTFL
jgi:large subunit ribosomal protein L17